MVVESVVVELVLVWHVLTTSISLSSKVTAPVSAMSEPSTDAPVWAVMDACANIIPLNADATPSDAEDPTCQMTLHSWAPFNNVTVAPAETVRLEPIWKTN